MWNYDTMESVENHQPQGKLELVKEDSFDGEPGENGTHQVSRNQCAAVLLHGNSTEDVDSKWLETVERIGRPVGKRCRACIRRLYAGPRDGFRVLLRSGPL